MAVRLIARATGDKLEAVVVPSGRSDYLTEDKPLQP